MLYSLISPNKSSMRKCLVVSLRTLTFVSLLSLISIDKVALAQETPYPRGKLQYKAKPGIPLTLIDHSDPVFRTHLEANFPGLLSMKSIEAAMPYMVVIRNDTPKVVRAYEIRWNPTDTKIEASETLRTTAVSTPLELRWPAGNKLQDKSLRPGEERLVTPWANVRRDETSFFDPTFAQTMPAILSPLKASVDCVIYGDGSFHGPNQSRLLLTYFITRDAQHDEALTILQNLRRKPGDPDLKRNLARRIEIGGSSSFNGNRAMTIYKAGRAKAAQEFAEALKDGRYHSVRTLARDLVASMPPHENFTPLETIYRKAKFLVGDALVASEE